jgi:hypothetical protein
VHEIYDIDTANQSMFGAAVLQLDQLNRF